MATQRLDIVRQLNAAANGEGDWIRFYDPEAELVMPREWLDQGVHRGHDALAEVLDQWRSSFDDYRWDEQRLIEGDECVVGLYFNRGRIKGVASEVERPLGAVFRFRGELISRLEVFFSWEEALEAGGVEG